MFNKDNCVPWSSRIIRYARSRPNGKIIVDSIKNVPYVRRMIATPGEPDLHVPEEVNEIRAERLAKSHDPLALMAHSQSSYNFPITHKDQSSSSTHSQQSFPINNKNCTARPKRRDAAYLQTQLLIAQKEEVGIQLQAEEFDFMAAAGDLDEIEEFNANYILMANLQHASTSSTQLDKALVYDTDGSAKVQLNDNCYDNEIFNMFTQKEQYTDLLEPIPEP
nr:hypothetical protein [Tanacetum cinerariifolium]